MSHTKDYIQKSLLIPPEIKDALLIEEMNNATKDYIEHFIDTYASLEQEILTQVNKELVILNAQIKNYLHFTEATQKEQDIREMEQEIMFI